MVDHNAKICAIYEYDVSLFCIPFGLLEMRYCESYSSWIPDNLFIIVYAYFPLRIAENEI